MHKAEAMQRAVERHYSDLAETAADALGNVALVQSFARIEREVSSLKSLVNSLLRAQMPVLSWWAVAAVLTRAATTLTLLVIFLVGICLKLAGLASVGAIVSFMALAGAADRPARTDRRLRQPPVPRCAEAAPSSSPCSTPCRRCATGRTRSIPAACAGSSSSRRVVLLRRQASGGRRFELHGAAGRDRSRWSGRPAAASRPRSRCCIAPSIRSPASITIDGMDIRALKLAGAAPQYRRRVPGDAAVQPLDRREPARRQAGRHRRRDPRRGRARAGARIHRAQPRRLRRARRRARPLALRRRAPAAGDRPRAAERPADPDSRRGDQRARRHHRAQVRPRSTR